jgi:phage shock protein C
MAPKKLLRSKKNRMIAGVCGGIGEYFNVDPNIVRLIWIVLSLFPPVGIGGVIVYILAALIIPEAGDDDTIEAEYSVKEE